MSYHAIIVASTHQERGKALPTFLYLANGLKLNLLIKGFVTKLSGVID